MEMTHFHGINSTYSFSAVKAEMSAVQKQVQISMVKHTLNKVRVVTLSWHFSSWTVILVTTQINTFTI